MIDKLLELIDIGSRKPTNDGKSVYRTIRFQSLTDDCEYVLRVRDDSKVSELNFTVGQIWKGLSLLQPRLSYPIKEPETALDSEYVSEDLIVVNPGGTYRLLNKETTNVVNSLVLSFKRGNNLLILVKKGLTQNYTVTEILNYQLDSLSVTQWPSLSRKEIAESFFINFKKFN